MSFLKEIDHSVFFAVHQLQKFNLDPLLAWPTHLGSLRWAVPLVFIFTLFQSRQRILARFLFAAAPVLITYAVVEYLKHTLQIPRPFTVFENQPGLVNVIFDKPSNMSFPSGHAGTAFSTALALHACFGISRWIVLPLAVLVCFTRMYIGVHFPSDLIGGAFLASLNCFLFFKFFRLKESSPRFPEN